MPKDKTHKATSKRLTPRKNDYKIGKPGSRHNTGKESASAGRANRRGSSLSQADMNRLV